MYGMLQDLSTMAYIHAKHTDSAPVDVLKEQEGLDGLEADDEADLDLVDID